MKTLVDITNTQLKRVCRKMTIDTMGMTPSLKDIRLLEASERYVLWAIGNTTYSYMGLIKQVCFYPNLDSIDGCVVAKNYEINIEEAI